MWGPAAASGQKNKMVGRESSLLGSGVMRANFTFKNNFRIKAFGERVTRLKNVVNFKVMNWNGMIEGCIRLFLIFLGRFHFTVLVSRCLYRL